MKDYNNVKHLWKSTTKAIKIVGIVVAVIIIVSLFLAIL